MSKSTREQAGGQWVYSPGCKVPRWVPAEPAPVVSVPPVVTPSAPVEPPTKRGFKSRNYGDDSRLYKGGLGVPKRLDAHVDWLTLMSTQKYAVEGARQLYDLAVELVDIARSRGDDLYEGREIKGRYHGFGCGSHVFHGTSESQGTYLRVSGALAREAAERVVELQERFIYATRLDYQVTQQYPVAPTRNFFLNMTNFSLRFCEGPDRAGRPWVADCVYRPGRGDTVYLGDRRTAEHFSTAYDKHKEGLHTGVEYPVGAVRYEVRLRKDRAEMELDRLSESACIVEHTAGFVRGYFMARGVDPMIDVGARDLLPGLPHRSDTESRRKWFREQVRGAARKNAEAVGLLETLRDLGLDEMVLREFGCE